MVNKLTVEVVTQAGVTYSDTVDGLVAPGMDGYFGVWPNHAPLIAELGVGELRVRQGKAMFFFALSGGVFHVAEGAAVVMADAAEAAEKIDVHRAEEARRRAEERIGEAPSNGDIDVRRAQAALARALNRLRVAGAKPAQV